MQSKAGLAWIYGDAFLMNDIVIWHQVQLQE